MTYNVKIGYRTWTSTNRLTFHEVVSGTIEQDSHNECTFFKSGNKYLDYEDIEKVFQETRITLLGLLDAVIISIDEVEFYGVYAFTAFEEVMAGDSPYEMLHLYRNNFLKIAQWAR